MEYATARRLEILHGDLGTVARATMGQGCSDFEGGEHGSSVTIDERDHGVADRSRHHHTFSRCTSLQQGGKRRGPEWAELPERRPAEERGVDREERILGGCPNEGNRPIFNRREERILLRPREPVHFVEEHNGSGAVLAEAAFCLVNRRTDVLHPCGDRREGNEVLP